MSKPARSAFELHSTTRLKLRADRASKSRTPGSMKLQSMEHARGNQVTGRSGWLNQPGRPRTETIHSYQSNEMQTLKPK